MTSFSELLKQEENPNRTGFKNGAWFPHKSPEGGTRTIGYGHKLTEIEERNGYIELPDGSIVDFSDRGLTDQEIDSLFQRDLQRFQNVAKTQWNQAQPAKFESLDPLYQGLLTEIAFNVGSLRNDKGKFGWPSLAKGILNNDIDVVKQEIARSFVDPKGVKKPLTKRVDAIRGFIDQHQQAPDQFPVDFLQQAPDTQQAQSPSADSFLSNLTRYLSEQFNGPSRASQTPSEGNEELNPTERAIVDAMKNSMSTTRSKAILSKGEQEAERASEKALLQKKAAKELGDTSPRKATKPKEAVEFNETERRLIESFKSSTANKATEISDEGAQFTSEQFF